MTVSAAIMNRIHDLIAGGMALSSVAKGISALSLVRNNPRRYG
jgi:hypothetical protein